MYSRVKRMIVGSWVKKCIWVRKSCKRKQNPEVVYDEQYMIKKWEKRIYMGERLETNSLREWVEVLR